MQVSRRGLVKGVGGLAVVGAAGLTFGARPAQAAWGDAPSAWPLVWPAGYSPKKILEIHMVGGVSPWETFWVMSNAMGAATFANYDSVVAGLQWTGCTDLPTSGTQTRAFGRDADGRTIHWGPATRPLWRPDILDRARMVALSHDFPPHEAASPYAITGTGIGRPTLAGTGAAIQHRQIALTGAGTRPYSYILAAPSFGIDDYQVGFGAAVGLHPGYAQPLVVRVNDPALGTLLGRSGVSAEEDSLLDVYTSQYRKLLTRPGAADPIRSSGLAEYQTAQKYLKSASGLQPVLGGTAVAVGNSSNCVADSGSPASTLNMAQTQMRLAANLLNDGARHVMIFDGGVLPGSLNYDIHSGGPGLSPPGATSAGVFRLASALAAAIRQPGEPASSNKVSLDDVMVVINSEFGRSVSLEIDGEGREHWPYGYPAVVIGGPLPASASGDYTTNGRRIFGGINSGGLASGNFTPADLRGAMLLAADVNPFEPENFFVQSFSVNDGTESGTRLKLKQRILGL